MKIFLVQLLWIILASVKINTATTNGSTTTPDNSSSTTTTIGTTPPMLNMSSSTLSTNDTSTVVTSTAPTQTTSNPSTDASLQCLEGGCYGNISCLQELENMTCTLEDEHKCFVYKNSTNTFYTAGCSENCEETTQEAGTGNYTVTLETYCCDDRSMCNDEPEDAQNSKTSKLTYSDAYGMLILFPILPAFCLLE